MKEALDACKTELLFRNLIQLTTIKIYTQIYIYITYNIHMYQVTVIPE